MKYRVIYKDLYTGLPQCSQIFYSMEDAAKSAMRLKQYGYYPEIKQVK